MFIITKADSKQKLIYLTASSEKKDEQNQIMDYDKSKPYFEQWSNAFAENTNGKSYGNVRLQHNTLSPIGKIAEPLIFDDINKTIQAIVKVVDDKAWDMVEEGVLTGASIGGRYVGKQTYDSTMQGYRYVVNPIELSLVDKPCNPDSQFQLIKADGTSEFRSFNTKIKEQNIMNQNEVIKVALAEEVQKVFSGTDNEKRERLRGALYSKITVPLKLANSEGSLYLWIRDIYADKVIFAGNLDGDNDDDIYQIGYSISDDGVVTFTGDPMQVRTEYVPAVDEDPATEKPVDLTILKTDTVEETNVENTVVENVVEPEVSKTDEVEVVEPVIEQATPEIEKTDTVETPVVEVEPEVAKTDEVVEQPTEEVQTSPQIVEKADETTITVNCIDAKTLETYLDDPEIKDMILKTVQSKLGIEIPEVEKVGAKHSKSHIEDLQKVSHNLIQMGMGCSCEKCSSVYNVNGDVQKADSVAKFENALTKIETLEKAVTDLSSQKDELVLKVQALEKLPDDTNAPQSFAVNEKTLVTLQTEQDVTKADTVDTNLTAAQQSQQKLANTWQQIQSNPVPLR